MKLSVVVPVLDEAPGIAAALDALAPLRAQGHEVIVVDGGSRDATRDLAV
ncbi:MAG TPA: glycosyltransferase, partial [Casimicrobiaceae bacterium]|nr:glycosyltransferase [Casimicrobiaceae bacterium]